MQVTVGIRECK